MKMHYYLVITHINTATAQGFANSFVSCKLPYVSRATLDAVVTKLLEECDGKYLRTDVIVTTVNYLGHMTEEEFSTHNGEVHEY